jgi:hypothetical protein
MGHMLLAHSSPVITQHTRLQGSYSPHPSLPSIFLSLLLPAIFLIFSLAFSSLYLSPSPCLPSRSTPFYFFSHPSSSLDLSSSYFSSLHLSPPPFLPSHSRPFIFLTPHLFPLYYFSSHAFSLTLLFPL